MKRRSVLLVDDVELFLELEQTFFHRDGFDLLMAVNAQEIMHLVLERRPDLIFLDLLISGAKGDDICRWIKADLELRKIPVVMLIDGEDGDAEERCKKANCNGILQRPVKRSQLLEVSRQMLDLFERQQARIAKRLLVQFGPDPKQLKSHFTVNISTGGMFLASDEIFPIGTPLALRVQIPGEKPLRCQGQVAWLNHPQSLKKPHLPTGMGIRFRNLAEPELELMEKFLNRRAA